MQKRGERQRSVHVIRLSSVAAAVAAPDLPAVPCYLRSRADVAFLQTTQSRMQKLTLRLFGN